MHVRDVLEGLLMLDAEGSIVTSGGLFLCGGSIVAGGGYVAGRNLLLRERSIVPVC